MNSGQLPELHVGGSEAFCPKGKLPGVSLHRNQGAGIRFLVMTGEHDCSGDDPFLLPNSLLSRVLFKWDWSYCRPTQWGEGNQRSVNWVTPKCPANPTFAHLLLNQIFGYWD